MGLRATVGKCMMDSAERRAGAAAGANARRRSTRASRCSSAGTARPTAGCAPRSRRASRCRARASCSKRSRRSPREQRVLVHTHASESRDEVEVVRRLSGGLHQPRVPGRHRPRDAAPLRRALRLGDRARAGAARRARRQGPALPRLEPEARIGHRAGRRDAGARHLGVARRRRRGLQQPARHVRRDAARGDAPGGAARTRRAARPRRRCGWRRAKARARSGWRARSDRSSPASAPTSSSSTATGLHLQPDRDPWSTLVYAARGTRRPADDGGRRGPGRATSS